MDSEEPPNVRVACSGDIDEVVRLMHDAAAWMSAKGTPAWDVARIDRTFAETGSVAKIVKLEHAWRRLDGRNDDGFQVAPFPG
jgi:S-adenosylmethionine:diacylglycerol 3-amino-3-carboxypropyl transferase